MLQQEQLDVPQGKAEAASEQRQGIRGANRGTWGRNWATAAVESTWKINEPQWNAAKGKGMVAATRDLEPEQGHGY